MKLVGMVFSALLLVGCGGGGGGGTGGIAPTPTPGDGGATPPSVQLALMVDSLGRTIPESNFGGGDSDAAGADGSAGDGAPIANAPVVLVDNAGHTATATTDALGYYRVNVKGFTPPFVVKVTRPDGTVWYSHSTSPVKTRGFVTMNITGLTDKVGGYVADAIDISGGADAVTPRLLAANPTSLQTSKTKLTTNLASPLTYVGLSPSTFDPVASPYQAVKSDNYDRLLERLIFNKDPAKGNTVVVGTFAGIRESFVNGTGTAATFGWTADVAVDSSGNLFVADPQNYSIRKITPAGVVSTFAGSGSAGSVNGTGEAASFISISGIAVDSGGNVFVADSNNQDIRKITPTGIVSTFADVSHYFSNAVAVDNSGNVFVPDRFVIRKITPAGIVRTFAGNESQGFTDGAGAAASFNIAEGVSVDKNGNVFVADSGNHAIRKITPAGVVSTVAGNGSCGFANGTGTIASFCAPTGVAVDGNGNVFVADSGNNAIRKITPVGVVSTVAGAVSGGFADGSGTAALFNSPRRVALDSSGNVFVADSGNHAIRKITTVGVVSTIAGSGSGGFADGTGTAARFHDPTNVAVDSSGNMFVADVYNHAIRKITPSGVVTTFAGNGVSGYINGTGSAASFSWPRGVAVDSSGNVFVADTANNAIRKITAAGVVSTFIDHITAMSVAVDNSGNVFVADYYNGAVHKINSAGIVSSFSGFYHPEGVAVDSGGNVIVADTGNNVIRKITPAGVVSIFSGSGSFGFTDGTGSVARFMWPKGVAVDSKGNVFVADAANDAIRRINPAGVVSTLSGDGVIGYRNDTGTGARFAYPTGVAVDGRGNVFVADSGNNAIRIILP